MNKKKYAGKELRKLNNMMKRSFLKSDFRHDMENTMVTSNWIIGFLADNKDVDIFQRDIEKNFSIRRSTVSNILQLMEKKGLVTRESVEYDARLKKITLTEKALEIHQHMIDDMEEREEKLIQGISEGELEVFFSVLEKMEKNITCE